MSSGSNELHFPLHLSNGSDVNSRENWSVRVKMAEYLASIFGTEKDKVNCSFYFKIGACRHGDRCSRLHNKPTFSQVRPGTEPGGWLMPTRRLSSVVHHLEALPFPDF